MAILQKLVSHGGKRLSLYADKGCHLRKMAALLFPEESSTILRLRSDYHCLARVGRLELPASCSQMCVGTFNRHSTALFDAFRCLGSSSLTLFRPACFKKTFRLLGFVWDWILCIKRCSVRF